MMTGWSVPDLTFWRTRKLPVFMSGETSECGLVCMAMIATYWGYRTDLQHMRSRFTVSMKGSNLRSLMAMASGLKLQSRPLKVPMSKLGSIKLPCILHWDMNHFVVLSAVKRRSLTIHDPSVGKRNIPMDEVSKHFTGVALEMTPSSEFVKGERTKPFTLLSLAGRIVGLPSGLAQLFILGIALQACTIVAPFYMQWVVDEALVAADRNLMTVLGVGFLLLLLVQTAISAVRSWAVTTLSANFNFQWLGNAFAHLMRLPLSYFERRHLGDIVSRFGSIQTIQKTITTQLVEALLDGILAVGTFLVMLIYSVKLTIVSLVVIAAYFLVRLALIRAIRDATSEQILHDAKQHTHFLESARGIQSIRLFGKTEERRVGWLNVLADQVNAELRVTRMTVAHTTIQAFLFGAEKIVVVWMAAGMVMDSQFSIGMLFAFMAYKEQFTQRVGSLVDKGMEMRMLRLHGERVADIILSEPEEDDSIAEIDVDNIEASIELRNVSFRYSDAEQLVLDGVNLKIEAGENIAITGLSGCGKTTLLKLILGLLDPTEGEILVGGLGLKAIGMANFRKMVGCVMQDDTIFSGSVEENIAFFDPSADASRVEEAASMAAIDGEISSMPMAYQTLLGDGGSGLSGGQKQRVLLARALYRKPRILTLDEATSHLDITNEQHVNNAIRQCDVTRVVVAHRPETISMSSRVVVLEDGKIVRDMAVPKQTERQRA